MNAAQNIENKNVFQSSFLSHGTWTLVFRLSDLLPIHKIGASLNTTLEVVGFKTRKTKTNTAFMLISYDWLTFQFQKVEENVRVFEIVDFMIILKKLRPLK